MNKWKEYKLNDLVTKLGDGLHGTPKYDPNGDYYFINGSNLIDGKISVNDNTKRVTKEEFDKYKKELTDRTIFVSINGTLGNIATYNNEKVVLGKSACYFIVKEDVSKEFIKYIVTDKAFQHYIYEYATGTTIKNVPLKAIREYTFKLPDYDTQTAIAEILSSFDDKIELNNKINQELENLAQTLFRQWFIDFEFPDENGKPYKFAGGEMIDSELGEIPKEWEVKRLKEILTIKRGGSPRPIQDFIAKSGLPWVKISDATAIKSPFLFSTKEFIKPEGLKKTILMNKGSLVLSNSATPGLPIFLELDACIHDGWLHFQNIQNLSYNFLYLFFLSIRENLIGQGNGSIFINLKTDILKEYKTTIPNADLITKFEDIVGPILQSIKENSKELIELTNLRDILLPKLISGELEVSEVLTQNTML